MLAFADLHASISSLKYLEHTEVDTYDTGNCSRMCDRITGCQSFNIYFERKPLLALGPGCRISEASATIKCAFWGGMLNGDKEAKNTGYKLWDFEVAMAGSNGYNKGEGVKGAAYALQVSSLILLVCGVLAWTHL
jgi:hypothetical protein